jgi:magnesium-transporting ATPase (P-type)
LTLFLWQTAQGASPETARTLAVNALVANEAFYLFNSRYLYDPVLSRNGLLGSRAVLATVSILLVIQLAFTYWPPMQHLLGTAPISAVDWVIIASAGLALLLLVELEKAIWRRLKRRMAH